MWRVFGRGRAEGWEGRGETTSKEAVLFVKISVYLPADEIIPFIVCLEPRNRILSVDRPTIPAPLSLSLRSGSKNPRSIPESLRSDPCSLARNSRTSIILFFAHAHPDPCPASPRPIHPPRSSLGAADAELGGWPQAFRAGKPSRGKARAWDDVCRTDCSLEEQGQATQRP